MSQYKAVIFNLCGFFFIAVKQRGGRANRQTERDIDRETEREAERQRLTDGQRDRHRQAGRQAGSRLAETEIHFIDNTSKSKQQNAHIGLRFLLVLGDHVMSMFSVNMYEFENSE